MVSLAVVSTVYDSFVPIDSFASVLEVGVSVASWFSGCDPSLKGGLKDF